MRSLAFLVSLFICTHSLSFAEGASIEETISAQVEAFQQDDVDGAFVYASPTIQRLFGTPENFGSMVRNGYPTIWRPSEFRFLKQRTEGDTIFQETQFFDANGMGHGFVYEMIKIDGEWRINGVFRMPAKGTGV